MIIGFLLFTNINHDLITNLSSGFGVIATIGVLIGLYKIGWKGLFVFGLLNFLLVGINNYVYYTNGLIIYLPIIQKITFALFLSWVCSIDLNLYYGQRKTAANKSIAASGTRRYYPTYSNTIFVACNKYELATD